MNINRLLCAIAVAVAVLVPSSAFSQDIYNPMTGTYVPCELCHVGYTWNNFVGGMRPSEVANTVSDIGYVLHGCTDTPYHGVTMRGCSWLRDRDYIGVGLAYVGIGDDNYLLVGATFTYHKPADGDMEKILTILINAYGRPIKKEPGTLLWVNPFRKQQIELNSGPGGMIILHIIWPCADPWISKRDPAGCKG